MTANPPAEPFAHFQWNDAWGVWEQVSPKAAGKPGVVAAFAAAPPPPASDLGTKLRDYVSRNVFYGTGAEAADLLREAAALIDAQRVRIGELEKYHSYLIKQNTDLTHEATLAGAFREEAEADNLTKAGEDRDAGGGSRVYSRDGRPVDQLCAESQGHRPHRSFHQDRCHKSGGEG